MDALINSIRRGGLALAVLSAPLVFGTVGQEPAAKEQDKVACLVERAESTNRERWWPAAEELGRLADTDEKLRARTWEQAQVNTLGMKFAKIEPGAFIMGPDRHRVFDPQPAHQVRLTKGVYLAVTEVTNAQFQRFFPEAKPDEYSPDPDAPAVNVSWEDADRFCKLLSEKEGVRYRLPTEAEWEYACRAGSTSRYCFGDDFAKLPQYAQCYMIKNRASPVATLKPNAWGLYDMHGNAFEWVSDWYSDAYYEECRTQGVVEDPQGPERGRVHVLRGGGWQVENPEALTSTARFPLPILDRVPFKRGPGFRQTIGFRIAREP